MALLQLTLMDAAEEFERQMIINNLNQAVLSKKNQ
jgi:hypothetical protein